MDDDLKKILETDMLKTAGLEHAAPEIRERALADAKNEILGAVVRQIRTRLSPELREKFEHLFGTENVEITEEDMAFLKEHAPDLDALILAETLAFKKGVMDTIEETEKKSADKSQKINGILNGLKD
ncbi:MAG: hypothetical protein HY617_03495 [Candidatus Sungbacteria bacterium]|nr:hypothetical protein [Candidatus Sungbacteria bacterium]